MSTLSLCKMRIYLLKNRHSKNNSIAQHRNRIRLFIWMSFVPAIYCSSLDILNIFKCSDLRIQLFKWKTSVRQDFLGVETWKCEVLIFWKNICCHSHFIQLPYLYKCFSILSITKASFQNSNKISNCPWN